MTALAGLAQESRLDVFRLLVEAGPEGLAVGQIVERLAIPAPTLSFHLRQLKHARLVEFCRVGRSLIYSADFEKMNALMGFLSANCCGGAPDACGLPAPGFAVCPPAASVAG